MIKCIVFLLIILNAIPANADIVSYSKFSPNYGRVNTGVNNNLLRSRALANMHQHQHKQICPECHYNDYLTQKHLKALEKHAFNRNYNRDSRLKRLERLEKLAFGTTQRGDLRSRYHNVENAILSYPEYNAKPSLMNNLANYFRGQATGFTPSIVSPTQYNNLGGINTNPYIFTQSGGFGNNSLQQFSNGIWSNGWNYGGMTNGAGSSIRILD